MTPKPVVPKLPLRGKLADPEFRLLRSAKDATVTPKPVIPKLPLRGKLADPEFRRERARKAAAARTTLDSHIRAIVDRAPELTAEQAATLRAALGEPGDGLKAAA
ncbi:hypothetical protein JIG36_32100 [Actinoplanes sp. LDG1-06]|uniref:Uncharacterized protein n=1 Tax=Paractinoplanes ovalisporus TaxID=2810368 RepID=A0ABS2AK24_9ACTN|nr:hypothetical protein [Actinoplanes ovalisporus]MBM2620167.1 hypothetical protein [Actinoplanes ovalisporus]